MGADRAAWSKNAMSAGRGSKKYRHFDFSRVFLLPSGATGTAYVVPGTGTSEYVSTLVLPLRRTSYVVPGTAFLVKIARGNIPAIRIPVSVAKS